MLVFPSKSKSIFKYFKFTIINDIDLIDKFITKLIYFYYYYKCC